MDFLRSSCAFIQRAGIRNAIGPVRLMKSQVGDTEDHAAPGSKGDVIAAYAKLLEPLVPESATLHVSSTQ
jgi:hypothetical protein